MKFIKLFFGLSILVLFNGCIQSTALLGPGMTLATTGNVFQAGLQYGANSAIKNETGKKDFIILGSLITFSILLSLSAHTDFVISIYILIGLFAGLAAGPIMGLPSEVLTPENRGIGIGIFLSLFYVGVVLAPILAGALLETTENPGAAFYLGSVLLMLARLAQLSFSFLAKRVTLSSTN